MLMGTVCTACQNKTPVAKGLRGFAGVIGLELRQLAPSGSRGCVCASLCGVSNGCQGLQQHEEYRCGWLSL